MSDKVASYRAYKATNAIFKYYLKKKRALEKLEA